MGLGRCGRNETNTLFTPPSRRPFYIFKQRFNGMGTERSERRGRERGILKVQTAIRYFTKSRLCNGNALSSLSDEHH